MSPLSGDEAFSKTKIISLDLSAEEEETGRAVLDAMRDEVGKIVKSRNPDARGLLNAMLLTSSDSTGLSTAEVLSHYVQHTIVPCM